ncbi:MAG TPA: hypothetical protein VGG74_16620 [Kofleriaceae bacterium]|jgi:hypothetical protein
MRSGLLIAIASACASPAGHSVARTTEPASRPSPEPAAHDHGPLVTHAATGSALEAPPLGAIQFAAVTPDGSSAITADAGGGVRLWPALDGTREPIVIEIDAPVDAAIEHAGSGFIVATIDEGRDLVLTVLDDGGRIVAHRGLGGDPGFEGVAAVDGGVLAWTSDSKIDLFGTDGALRGTIATEPGERLRDVATARAHAVADLEIAGSAAPRRRVRAVTVGSALAWGGFLGSDHAPSGPIAIAPSGNRLAMVEGDNIVVLDLAHDTKLMETKGAASSLAFADDDRLAASAGLLAWFTQSGLVPRLSAGPVQATGGAGATFVTTGANAAVAIVGGVLAIATPQHLDFLGYAIMSPSVAAAGGSGTLVIGGNDVLTVLDGSLHSHDTIAATTPRSLAWLGGDNWLAVGNGATRALSLRDADAVTVGSDTTEVLASYEPSTSIATASFGNLSTVYRWDAVWRALRPVASSPRTAPYLAVQLVPTAPARAHGTHVVRVLARDHATVEWFSDDKLAVRTAVAEVASVLAVDSSARVYALTQGVKPHVAILANGAEIGRLPLTASAALYPDETGDRVAALTARSLDLYVGGKQLWSHPVLAGRLVAWLSDGSIALVSAASIERLDAETGRSVVQRCGWSFGLWPAPIAPAPQRDSPCSR